MCTQMDKRHCNGCNVTGVSTPHDQNDDTSSSTLCMQEIAAKVDGYDAADMRVLLDRAALAAARRNLADISLDNSGRHHSTLPSGAQQTQHSRALQAPPTDVSTAESVSVGVADVETGVPIEMSGENGRRVRITGDDLSTALRGFTPAAYWGVGKLSGGSGVQARPSFSPHGIFPPMVLERFCECA